MREWADFNLEDRPGEGSTLALSGPLRVYTIGDLDRRLEKQRTAFDRLDLSSVTDIDTAGAWLVKRWSDEHDAEIDGASDLAKRLIAAVGRTDETHVEPPTRPGVFRAYCSRAPARW